MANRFTIIKRSDLSKTGQFSDADLEGGGYVCIGDGAEPNYAYVAAATDKVVAVDVSDPTDPSKAGALGGSAFLESMTAITFNYDHVIVASSSNTSIAVVKILDPTAMFVQRTFTDASLTNVVSMQVIGPGALLVASKGDNSIKTVGFTEILDSVVDNSIFEGLVDLSIQNDVAYVLADTSTAFTSVDVTDPFDLTVVDTVTSANLAGATSLYVEGDYAYITTSGNYVIIINIADPSNMEIIVEYEYSGGLGSFPQVIVEGNVTYVLIDEEMISIDFTSTTYVTYDEMPFVFDGTFDVDSRLYLEFGGPAEVLAITYELEDADNSPPKEIGPRSAGR